LPCSLLQSHIEIIHGHAAFTSDPQPTVEVNGKKYTAPHILIATGGVPSVPPESQIPGESCKGRPLLGTEGIHHCFQLYKPCQGICPLPVLCLGHLVEGLCRPKGILLKQCLLMGQRKVYCPVPGADITAGDTRRKSAKTKNKNKE